MCVSRTNACDFQENYMNKFISILIISTALSVNYVLRKSAFPNNYCFQTFHNVIAWTVLQFSFQWLFKTRQNYSSKYGFTILYYDGIGCFGFPSVQHTTCLCLPCLYILHILFLFFSLFLQQIMTCFNIPSPLLEPTAIFPSYSNAMC